MHFSLSRLSVFVLVAWLCLTPCSLAQKKKRPNKSQFEDTAEILAAGSAMQLVHHWHMPHFMSWRRLKGHDLAPEDLKRIQSFPNELTNALNGRDKANRLAAVEFLASYASFVHGHAAHLGDKDPSSVVASALAPHTEEIRKALIECLEEKDAPLRFSAAFVLLCLDPTNPVANDELRASLAKADKVLLEQASRSIGLAKLPSPQALKFLGRMLSHENADVREAAAGAVITMGPSARDLLPGLVAFLKTGDAARGSYQIPFAIALPERGNLALMALEALGEHARPAALDIARLFPKANEEDQIAMLACLAKMRCKEAACQALVRNTMQRESSDLKLAAACALLHLDSEDRTATDLICNALANEKTRRAATEICQRIGPPSSKVAASLLPWLESKEEDVRIETTHALAQIGPHAAKAVPAIEKLLAKEENGTSHTFQSSRVAAYALAKIRGKDAAAALSRVADSKASGAQYAMMYLPDLGDDLPPRILPALVRALQDKERPRDFAAIALSNLGERARPVRRDIERYIDDPEIGWIIDTALRRIPAKPK